jgi:hypothetical protein
MTADPLDTYGTRAVEIPGCRGSSGTSAGAPEHHGDEPGLCRRGEEAFDVSRLADAHHDAAGSPLLAAPNEATWMSAPGAQREQMTMVT